MAGLFLLLASGLVSADAMTLRGVAAPAPASAASLEAAAKKGAAAAKAADKKLFVDDRGERGHFYYAKSCDDCFYKSAQCGCQPAMEYMACVTKHCGAANKTAFADKCTALETKCADDLDIDCRSHETQCKSKSHQLPLGGIGLKVDVNEDEALCGPFGKCIGQLRMAATIVNGPKGEELPLFSPGPAPAASKPASPAAAGPAAGPAASPAPSAESIWLECGLPNKKKADIDSKEDWDICQAEADDGKAECDLPLPEDSIKASESMKAYCVLKEGEEGKRLTQLSWHSISNVHEKPKEEKPKVAAKKAPKEESNDDGHPSGFPWMDEKLERQEAAKKEAKKAAKKAGKKEDKKAKKAAKKEDTKEWGETGEPHESGLPWMEGEKEVKDEKPEKKEAAKKEDKKEEAKEEKPKKESIFKKKKQAKKEAKAKEEKAKEEKPKEEEESKEEEPKEEKPKKAAKKAEKEEEDADDSGKLPWMADKEERQAERKAAAANKPKKEEKKEKKAPKEESSEPHDSGLPWMEGKKNGQPAPGSSIVA